MSEDMTARPNLKAVPPSTAVGDDRGAGSLDDAVLAEVSVACSAPVAFDLFLDTLADWWPLRDFSAAPGEVVSVEVDRRPGGSIVEIHRDGSRAQWGTLLTWEPGHRFAMDWLVTPGLEQTVITVTFTATAPQQTSVQLVHAGWQGLDPARLGLQLGYSEGWSKVLGCFAESVRAR